MHELKRLQYLDAIGIDSYVSRTQLPGARPTRRLKASNYRPVPPSVPSAPVSEGVNTASQKSRPPLPEIKRRVQGESAPLRGVVRGTAEHSPTRFSLATVVAGKWLWVEDLQGMPLAREQVQLIQSMANALQVTAGDREAGSQSLGPQVSQFDWPIHTNQQLDLGDDAAQTAVAGFIVRKIEQHNLGLVLLGKACQRRIPLEDISCRCVAVSHSSSEMLQDPMLKKPAWLSLQSLIS